MSTEISPFRRIAIKLIGGGDVIETLNCPDTFNSYLLSQRQGIAISLNGPKNDLAVSYLTPTGRLSLHSLAPEDTHFVINPLKRSGFQANAPAKTVLIPLSQQWHNFPELGLIHEISHLWSGQELSWQVKCQEAAELLKLQRLSLDINGYVWLPSQPKKRQSHLKAWNVLGQDERRASAISSYLIAKLSTAKIDIAPHLSKADLIEAINLFLDTHQVFDQPLSFQTSQIEQFMLGNNLPISPTVKQQIDDKLNQTLTILN